MKQIAAAVLAAALASCATQPQRPVESWEYTEADTPFECAGQAQCATAWRAAQAWIAAYAGYKIQVATDAVVQTYNAQTYSTGWAFQLVREPRGGDRERFTLSTSCGQAPLCGMAGWRMLARFNRAMRQAVGAELPAKAASATAS